MVPENEEEIRAKRLARLAAPKNDAAATSSLAESGDNKRSGQAQEGDATELSDDSMGILSRKHDTKPPSTLQGTAASTGRAEEPLWKKIRDEGLDPKKASSSAPSDSAFDAKRQGEKKLASGRSSERKFQILKERLLEKTLKIKLLPSPSASDADETSSDIVLIDIGSDQITKENISEIIAERLALAPNSQMLTRLPLTDQKLISYLGACHRRISEELKSLLSSSSNVTPQQLQSNDELTQLLQEMKVQVVSYSATSLMAPDLFAIAQDGPKQLAQSLVQSALDPSTSIAIGVAAQLFGNKYSNSIQDARPEMEPFHFQFSIPATYHNPQQKFAVGDLVWYEVKGNFDITSKGIQWGEAVVQEILPDGRYCLAGKVWNYDHWTHPLIGLPGGPPQYSSLTNVHTGRDICRQWTIAHHPNFYVRRMAMSGVDKVMHSALRSVPGEAMFKVWDRESQPECPMPSPVGASMTATENGVEDSLEKARQTYGVDLGFQGKKQHGYGPEFWGITLEQLEQVKNLPGYDSNMTMYDVVQKLIKPITQGTGMGYALLLNKDQPLRAKQMTSHAWGEQYSDFVKALKDSLCEGPFWVCAMAIYQESDKDISEQLGPSLEHGPFATVLKQATDMIAVFTPAADIYLRMWCVFEIFVAVKLGVNVKFAALNQQFRSGIENIYDAIYEHGRNRCCSEKAECSKKSDEEEIRKLIQATDGKFAILDSVVEWCKAMYYIGEVHHPGAAFKSEPAHLLLMGGRGKLDYLAKTLSSIALAVDRISASTSANDVADAASGNPKCTGTHATNPIMDEIKQESAADGVPTSEIQHKDRKSVV